MAHGGRRLGAHADEHLGLANQLGGFGGASERAGREGERGAEGGRVVLGDGGLLEVLEEGGGLVGFLGAERLAGLDAVDDGLRQRLGEGGRGGGSRGGAGVEGGVGVGGIGRVGAGDLAGEPEDGGLPGGVAGELPGGGLLLVERDERIALHAPLALQGEERERVGDLAGLQVEGARGLQGLGGGDAGGDRAVVGGDGLGRALQRRVAQDVAEHRERVGRGAERVAIDDRASLDGVGGPGGCVGALVTVAACGLGGPAGSARARRASARRSRMRARARCLPLSR